MATDSQVETLFNAGLTQKLAQAFQQLEPLYHWLMQVEAMKQVDPADL